MRYARTNGKGGQNHVNVNGNGNAMTPTVMTPPAGTGKVLGSEPDTGSEVHEDGVLEGLGDGGRG